MLASDQTLILSICEEKSFIIFVRNFSKNGNIIFVLFSNSTSTRQCYKTFWLVFYKNKLACFLKTQQLTFPCFY
jgi:hypothetical protein